MYKVLGTCIKTKIKLLTQTDSFKALDKLDNNNIYNTVVIDSTGTIHNSHSLALMKSAPGDEPFHAILGVGREAESGHLLVQVC